MLQDAYRLCVRVENKDIGLLLRKGENQERDTEREISKGEG